MIGYIYIFRKADGYQTQTPCVSHPEKGAKIHRIPDILPNFHQIDQISIKWMTDRQFCNEKSIRNLSYLKRNTPDGEDKIQTRFRRRQFLDRIDHLRQILLRIFFRIDLSR